LPWIFLFLVSFALPVVSEQRERVYQGTDQNKPCYLSLHQELKNENGDYEVEVSTSYEHQGQGLGRVWLHFTDKPPSKMLLWERPATGESLRVLLKNEEVSLQTPQAFRVRWMHFDHLHDSTCSNLQKVNEP